MSQRRFWNFKADDLTIDLDHWFHGITLPGVYQGFDFGTQDSMTLHLIHSVTGSKYVNKEPPSESNFIGVIRTRQGVIIQEDANIDIPVPAADPSLPRIDLVFLSHTYVDAEGGEEAFYGIVEGTPNASPVAPTVADPLIDIPIATLYVPAGIADLTDSDVVYTKAEVPTIANENYAHRDKPNRYTKQAQNSPENSAITFDTGTNELTINSDSNLFALPTNITIADALAKITQKPSGTIIQLRVMTTAGITITHDPAPSAKEIFNEIDEQTITFPKGTTLDLVAQSDGSWRLFDYSVKAVWNRNNSFNKAQQFPLGSGIKIKYISYVVSSITYNAWILELDAANDNLILDMANATQMGGFNPASDVLEIRFIDVIGTVSNVGGANKANGWTPKIKVIGSAAGSINVLCGTTPLPVGSDYILLDNNSDLTFLNTNPVQLGFKLAELVSAGNSTFFQIVIGAGYKFSLITHSAFLKTFGGVMYGNNTFYPDGTNHNAALNALANELINPGTPITLNKAVNYIGPGEYVKSANGTVKLIGFCGVSNSTPAVNTIFAVLPVGYRPTTERVFFCPNIGVGVENVVVVRIESNGNCHMSDVALVKLSIGNGCYLDPVEFNINY